MSSARKSSHGPRFTDHRDRWKRFEQPLISSAVASTAWRHIQSDHFRKRDQRYPNKNDGRGDQWATSGLGEKPATRGSSKARCPTSRAISVQRETKSETRKTKQGNPRRRGKKSAGTGNKEMLSRASMTS